jgi:hypothetical protein
LLKILDVENAKMFLKMENFAILFNANILFVLNVLKKYLLKIKRKAKKKKKNYY